MARRGLVQPGQGKYEHRHKQVPFPTGSERGAVVMRRRGARPGEVMCGLVCLGESSITACARCSG